MSGKRRRTRPPIHPGIILKYDYLEPLSIKIYELAELLGVSRVTVSKIVNERAPVTANIALRLSKTFNTTPDLWLNLQLKYDLWHAENDSKEWMKAKPVHFDQLSQAGL